MKILAINKRCGRFNQVIDVSSMGENEIKAIIDSYDKTKWIIIKQLENES